MLATGVAVLIGVSCYFGPSELINFQASNLAPLASPASQYWGLLLHPSEAEGLKWSETGDSGDSPAIDSSYVLP